MQPNIISLGSWCRPAWQIRRHFGFETAFPFDWQITSAAALTTMLEPGYRAEDQLQIEDCVVNRFGSVTDTQSGLIYQHDLLAAAVGGIPGSIFMDDGPETRRLLDETRAKSVMIFERFRDIVQSGPTIFLRWVRSGDPDAEWSGVFEGERPHHLHRQLLRFCGHDQVRTLYVSSMVAAGSVAKSGCLVRPTSYGANAELLEVARLFREESWTGDDAAWSALCDAIAVDWLGLAERPVRAAAG